MVGVAVVAASTVIGGGAATAAPETTLPRPDFLSLIAHENITLPVLQRNLELFVEIDRTHGPGGTNTNLGVTAEADSPARRHLRSASSPTGSETHSWSFPVPNSAFTVNPKGSGTVKVPASRLSPYGLANLKLTPVGNASKQTCNTSTYLINQKVKVSGIFYFDTRSTGKHKWGHVGNQHKRTFKAAGNVTRAYGQQFGSCIRSSSPPCAKTLTWAASGHNGTVGLSGGVSSNKRGYLSGSRTVALSKPKGAQRTDSVQATGPAPKLTKGSGGSATMSVSTSGGSATGSAKIASTASGSTFSESCGKAKTESTESWTSALTNGKPPLALTEQIFGPIKLANGSVGSIDSTTP